MSNVTEHARKMFEDFATKTRRNGGAFYFVPEGSKYRDLVIGLNRDESGETNVPDDWVFETAYRLSEYFGFEQFDEDPSEAPNDFAYAAAEALIDWDEVELCKWLMGRFDAVDSFLSNAGATLGHEGNYDNLFELLRAVQLRQIEDLALEIIKGLSRMDEPKG